MSDYLWAKEEKRWAEMHRCGVKRDGTLFVAPHELTWMCRTYGEYSSSIPTGVVPGKMWMCKLPHGTGWLLREFVAVSGEPNKCFVESTPIEIDLSLEAAARLDGSHL